MTKYESLLERSKTKHNEIVRKMQHLNKRNKAGFDKAIFKIHDEVFAEIDCTECGLCCRNMGPIFRNTDLKHICAAIGTNEKQFKNQYLMQDPDGVGFMLKKLPCPFQNPDNTCSIYEERTLSCKNFPHTKEVGIHNRLGGLAMDSMFCPAAYLICEKIIEQFS